MAQPRLVCAIPAPPMQSEVAYEYFRDTFVLSTKSAYKKGQQVGRRTCVPLKACRCGCEAPAQQAASTAGQLSLVPPLPASLPTRCPISYMPQVFISYGAQSNGSLLQYYAFTERGNPKDVYVWQASIGGQQVQVRKLGGLLPDEEASTVCLPHSLYTVSGRSLRCGWVSALRWRHLLRTENM